MLNIELFKKLNKEFYSVSDIVLITGVIPHTVYKWIRLDVLPAQMYGGTYLILKQDVLNLMDKIDKGIVRLVPGVKPKI